MNIWKKFGIPAFTPVLLNAAMIGRHCGPAALAQPIHALATGWWSVAMLQLALQLWPLSPGNWACFPRLDFRTSRDEGVPPGC